MSATGADLRSRPERDFGLGSSDRRTPQRLALPCPADREGAFVTNLDIIWDMGLPPFVDRPSVAHNDRGDNRQPSQIIAAQIAITPAARQMAIRFQKSGGRDGDSGPAHVSSHEAGSFNEPPGRVNWG
ncbi:hypothetical protein AX777_20615 [Sphingobium yanoikuyae]|uniref:Uncharacterized protein n=1 Tax=Sphingobium yanoikuyae TaxID=13690 RepID=A0A177JWG4_SPHYA|nr:hypothetical protein AX777_20615 [Sphingobium yanoikuyae]